MLIRSSDLLVATSRGIAAEFGKAGALKAKELPNAADADAFMAALGQPCPDDLSAIPHPRIGYTGVISIKVDLPLIAEISEKRPDWHWVLVGLIRLSAHLESDIGQMVRQAYDLCLSRPNVHFLGNKPPSEVPRYAAHMDISTMCYHAEGGWWDVSYPLKVHEYLAVGKPVVSSRLPRVESEFASVIDFAEGTDDWIRAIETGLTAGGKGTPEERQGYAAKNTWDHRVDNLESWLIEMTMRNDG
jgi:glycosyltransferase involved in cell wall biosynthesis